jgi:hypothetical protein
MEVRVRLWMGLGLFAESHKHNHQHKIATFLCPLIWFINHKATFIVPSYDPMKLTSPQISAIILNYAAVIRNEGP